jgi:hypothetical protein
LVGKTGKDQIVKNSRLIGALLATCALAVSQVSLAGGDWNTHSAYGCRLVQNGNNYPEIPGRFIQAFYNYSGSRAWIICPLSCESSNSAVEIKLTRGGNQTCMVGTTDYGDTAISTDYEPIVCDNGGFCRREGLTCSTDTTLQIQCLIDNGVGVWGYAVK